MAEKPLPSGKWYDLDDLTEFHEDLRQDWTGTLVSAGKRPLLRKHMTECDQCAAIRSTFESEVAPVQPQLRRRMKVVITPTEMAKILGLPSPQSIIHMYADPDPNQILVLIESPELDPVSEAVESPVVRVSTGTEMAA